MTTVTHEGALLSQAEIDAVTAPIESARTLPRRAYTSVAFFEAERAAVAGLNWLAVCFADQIALEGDVLPIDGWGVPLVAVRGSDGVRVFHNVCPYDGCPVATERAQALTEMRVPYHGWRYDLDGRLLEAPFWDGRPDHGVEAVPEEHRDLVEVRSEVALGMVFVDLSASAPDIEDHLAPLWSLLDEYDLEGVATAIDESGRADVFESHVAANWKTFAENDCLNILHESFVHAMYARSPEVPRVDSDGNPRFVVVDDGDLMGFAYAEADVGDTYPPIDLPHIGRDGEPEHGCFIQLYPNVSIAAMPNLLAPIIQTPAAPDRSDLIGATVVRADMVGVEHREARQASDDLFAAAAEEDRAVIEAVQRARHSPARDQGFLNPFWDGPHHLFLKRVTADLAAGSVDVAPGTADEAEA